MGLFRRRALQPRRKGSLYGCWRSNPRLWCQASVGILYHYGNDAVYDGDNPAYAPPGISYHRWRECGGNFSFAISEKGSSKFSLGGQVPTPLEREAGGPGERRLLRRFRQDAD